MTTSLNPNGYAVVWYGDGDKPQVCTGMVNGKKIDGKTYAIYDRVEDAITEFKRWPLSYDSYGIVPARLVADIKKILVETEKIVLKNP